jgi:hypothetical protein
MHAGLHVLMNLSSHFLLPYATNQVFWFSGIERGSVRLSAETLAILVEYFVVLFSFSWSMATKCRNTPTSIYFNFFQSIIVYLSTIPELNAIRLQLLRAP